MNLFIEECFRKLSQNNRDIYNLDIEQLEDEFYVSRDMIKDQRVNQQLGTWELMTSSVKEIDIKQLEDDFKIKLPSLYKDFISSYAHLITSLKGTIDNDIFDEEGAVLEIPVQPYHKELEQIRKILGGNPKLLAAGYLIIGECDSYAVICIDLNSVNESEMNIIFFDHEDICECESREDFEEVGAVIFNNFKELLECFFMGIPK